MTKVAIEDYPENGGIYIDGILKEQIDVMVKNITNDWDFTIIISGEGEVRVGKSVLAMQIAAYWKYAMKKVHNIDVKYDVDNFVMDGRKLIETGNTLGNAHPYSPLIFDEAGADLEGRKAVQSMTQDVLDYFRECGQYNMLNILVLPEFFDLPKGLAVARSKFLLDVYYVPDEKGIFQRGYFKFYSWKHKKDLYRLGKKDLDYKAAPYNFTGRFTNFYPIDEAAYRAKKLEALKKRENRKRNKFQMQRDACWYMITKEGFTCKHCGEDINMTMANLGKRMEGLTGIYVPEQTISDAIAHFYMESEDKTDNQ